MNPHYAHPSASSGPPRLAAAVIIAAEQIVTAEWERIKEQVRAGLDGAR